MKTFCKANLIINRKTLILLFTIIVLIIGLMIVGSSKSQNSPIEAIKGIDYSLSMDDKWVEEVVPDKKVGLISSTSLAYDQNDSPCIAYLDRGYEIIKYATRDKSVWKIEDVDSTSVNGSLTTLVIDKNNIPHIFYGKLKHAWKENNIWHKEVVDQNGEVLSENSVILDKNNNLNFIYAGFLAGKLKFAKLVGNKWIINEIDLNQEIPHNPVLELDKKGNSFIVLFTSDINYKNFKLKSLELKGDNWISGIIDDKISFPGECNLSISTDNKPFVAYTDSRKRQLRLAKRENSNWFIETVANSVEQDISFKLSSDQPIIMYASSNIGQNYLLQYAKYSADLDQWSIYTMLHGNDSKTSCHWSSLNLGFNSYGKESLVFYDSIKGVCFMSNEIPFLNDMINKVKKSE